MNCIVLSDRISFQQLERCISEYRTLNLLGFFHDKKSFMDALSGIQGLDIAFIDIKLLGIENLALINNLNRPPNIIIVTSTDEFAIKAFDYGVIDYLLKPVTFPRFFRAVDKTSRYFLKKNLQKQDNEDIYIRKGTELVKLKLNDLYLLEGCENYVRLYIGKQKYAIHFTMKAIENQLPSDSFKRIHKSYIINRNYIKVIKEDTLDVIIGENVKTVPIGKTYKDSLIKSINFL